jgi:hypothetical protein
MQNKYNRTYHVPWSPGTTSDDRFISTLDDIIGHEIVVTEKLDGENNGIEKGGVYARSHIEYSKHPWGEMVRNVHKASKKLISNNEILFGENMEGIHSIRYDKLSFPFYLFAVRTSHYNKDSGSESMIFESWDTTVEYSKLFNFPTVPLLFRGIISTEKELKELTLELTSQRSHLDSYDAYHENPTNMEGVVIRRSCSFNSNNFKTYVAKWVRKDHVKTDEHWTKNWKRAKIKWK